MQTKTKSFSLGTITYQMPNILESMRLLGHIGFSKGTALESGQELMFVSKLIEFMQPLVTVIDCKKGEEEIKEWAKSLDHMEFLPVYSEIAGEILQHLSQTSGATEDRKNS